VAREVKISGRTVYLTDRDEWEETPTEPAPRAGPYALTVEVSGFVDHELYEGPPGLGYGVSDVVSGQIQCSSCGAPRDNAPGLDHWVVAPGGWRRCGEWR
jgi:hypothetical protein